ncbi:MAG: hypothetical protein ACLQMF_18155 [Rectinemataceae bacterium]
MRFFALCVFCLGLVEATALFGLEGELASDLAPTAALVSTAGPGSPLVQAETTRITTQLALTDSETLADGLVISGTGWLLLDSLPNYDPTQVPAARLDLSTRLLQLNLTWQILPGTLVWETGKQIIHPSSGFFRQPLDLISRGAAGNVPVQIPGAAPQWEEGWVGTKLDWLVGNFTFENFLSPPLNWSGGADSALQYLSLPQPDWLDQSRIDIHIGAVDMQLLGLVSAMDAGGGRAAVDFTGGMGLDANLGQDLTVRGEISAASSQDRITVLDPVALATASQSIPWAPRALIGLTWSFTPDLSLMGEYYYNGLGFAGGDYGRVLQFAQNRQSLDSSAPDLLGQFGTFDAARHYGFIRLADNVTRKLSLQGWSQVNLQDLSGMVGGTISVTNDSWGLSGSLMNTWGRSDTEAGLLPELWQFDIEAQVYF